MKYRDSSVWYASGSRYIIDGDTYRMTSKLWQNADADSVRSMWESYSEENKINAFQTYIDRWLVANRDRYNSITSEAMNAIQEVVQSLPANTPSFVSFSGGKDSTVTSSLVIRALSTPRILHIFGNTTLEFPETEAYIKKYKTVNPQIPWLVAKNTDKSFFDMCDVIGPPSRVMRWCCIVFKTGATKGLRHVHDQDDIFLRDDAIDQLGIGSAMVKSLRHWMQATGLSTEPKVGKRTQTLTPLGNLIYANDLYFEDDFTLCLIHYHSIIY